MTNIFFKLKLFCKSIIHLKNWYMFPIVYFRLTKKSFVYFKTRNGINLKIRTEKGSSDIHVFSEIWLDNVYLKEFNLKKNSVIMDIGSHIGLFSILASKKFVNGKIYSFEPNSYNYKILSDNIQSNNLKNISTFNSAVSNNSNFIQLYCNDDFAAHSIHKKTSTSITVKSTTIKDIFYNNHIMKCDLLKLDCEGAEYEILMNAPQEIFQKISKICLEIDYSNDKKTLNEIIKKLHISKFKTNEKQVSKKTGYLYAWK
jgi:FkbM family methyltransferase